MKLPLDRLAVLCALAPLFACALGERGSTPVDEPSSDSAAAATESEPAAHAREESPPAASQDTWTQAELEAVTREIQAEIEELRGEKFLRPVEVKVASREDFQAYAKRRLEMTESPEKLAGDETVAKLLGVVPADMDLLATMMALLEDQVGGYYDPASDSFSLMQGFPRGVARIILAHELDHALDDQLFGIDSRLDDFATNSDAGLAYSAVVEGSGTSIMNAWAQKHLSEVDLGGFEKMQKEAQDSMASAPAWMWKPLLAAYLQGAAFLARTDSLMAGQMRSAESEDIRRVFQEPPLSTEQVLHPDKYWDPALRDDPVRITFDTSELGENWKVLREDTLGELALAIVCSPPEERGGLDLSNPAAMLTLRVTNPPAEGWEGDRAVLLGAVESDDGGAGAGRVLRLVTRWETERDAGEFLGALEVLLPSLERAARALAGPEVKPQDSGALLEYGESPTEVLLTVRSNVDRVELKKLLRRLAHAVAAS